MIPRNKVKLDSLLYDSGKQEQLHKEYLFFKDKNQSKSTTATEEYDLINEIELIHKFVIEYITDTSPDTDAFMLAKNLKLDISFDALFVVCCSDVQSDADDSITIAPKSKDKGNNKKKYESLSNAKFKLPFEIFNLREEQGEIYCSPVCSKMAANIYKKSNTSPWYTTNKITDLADMIESKNSYDFDKHFYFDNLCEVCGCNPNNNNRKLLDLYLFENLTGAATVFQLVELQKISDFSKSSLLSNYLIPQIFLNPCVFGRAIALQEIVSIAETDELLSLPPFLTGFNSLSYRYYDKYFNIFINLLLSVFTHTFEPDCVVDCENKSFCPCITNALETYINKVGGNSISTNGTNSLYSADCSCSTKFANLEKCAIQTIFYGKPSFTASGERTDSSTASGEQADIPLPTFRDSDIFSFNF